MPLRKRYFSSVYDKDAVAQKKTLHMADIHKILSVKKSTTSHQVKPLIQKGLLRRKTIMTLEW
jgi:DNA-binding MarR family transcriptional regulator